MIKSLDLNFQHSQMYAEITEAFERLLKTNSFINGTEVENFEKNYASYTNTNNCISVGNGTDALELILEALGLFQCEIIMPALTFVATAEAVLRVNSKPVFVDVDESYTIDPYKIEEKITNKTKAIIAVNLHGNPANLKTIESIATKNNLFVIQDSAQSHGATAVDGNLDNFGIATAYSFYPGKNLGAIGDAGAITTNDDNLATTLRRIKNHGRLNKFDHEIVGRNSRLDAIQAAVLNIKLRYLDSWIERRRLLAKLYDDAFAEIHWLSKPSSNLNGQSSYHQYVITSNFKNNIKKSLKQNEIEYGFHYPYIVPELTFLKEENYANKYVKSNMVARFGLSLPIGEHLTHKDIETIVKTVILANQNNSDIKL